MFVLITLRSELGSPGAMFFFRWVAVIPRGLVASTSPAAPPRSTHLDLIDFQVRAFRLLV